MAFLDMVIFALLVFFAGWAVYTIVGAFRKNRSRHEELERFAHSKDFVSSTFSRQKEASTSEIEINRQWFVRVWSRNSVLMIVPEGQSVYSGIV